MATPPCPRPWLAPEVAVPLPDAGPPPNHRPRRGPSPGLAHGCGLLAAVLVVGALAAQPHGYARWLLRHDPNPTVNRTPRPVLLESRSMASARHSFRPAHPGTSTPSGPLHLQPAAAEEQRAPRWIHITVAAIAPFPLALLLLLYKHVNQRRCSDRGLVSMAALSGSKAPRRSTQLHGVDPSILDPALADALAHHVHHAPFAVGYGVPCQVQKCGDELYRATLDPVRRLEVEVVAYEKIIPPLLALTAYLFAKPGVAYGAWDNLIIAPLYRSKMKKLQPKKIKVGKKLGAGGFGVVYLATVTDDKTGKVETIVIKRAKEFGEAETWMNERINRALPGVCAQMLDSFEIKPLVGQKSGTVFGNTGKKELWLAFTYEGSKSVNDYLQDPLFPFNMEELLFGEPLDGQKDVQRKLLTVRELLRELTKATAAIHSIGIVHRDLKPQNAIVADDGSLRIIDLGCAADLRVGINYIPQEYVMDPRYAAPEMTVMSASTPNPPPAPVATFFAPALWLLNTPDRFDVYSLGIMFLQFCFPPLRVDSAIAQFNKKLASEFQFDLEAWRAAEIKRGRKEMLEGFELLDLDDKAGWELLKRMLEPKSRERPSAEEVLQSTFIKGPLVSLADRMRVPLQKILEVATDAADKYGFSKYIERLSANPVLSEAQLDEMFSEKKVINTPGGYQTMAWWETRKRSLTIATQRGPKPTFVDRLSDRLQDAIFKDRKF
eukprot:EG_transcript_3624